MKMIKQAEFEEVIREGVTVVDFYADWCGPCKMLGPVLEELDGEMADVQFVKVNVDDNGELAQKFGVMSIPCVYVFKNGSEAGHFVGLQPKDSVKKFIESHK